MSELCMSAQTQQTSFWMHWTSHSSSGARAPKPSHTPTLEPSGQSRRRPLPLGPSDVGSHSLTGGDVREYQRGARSRPVQVWESGPGRGEEKGDRQWRTSTEIKTKSRRRRRKADTSGSITENPGETSVFSVFVQSRKSVTWQDK